MRTLMDYVALCEIINRHFALHTATPGTVCLTKAACVFVFGSLECCCWKIGVLCRRTHHKYLLLRPHVLQQPPPHREAPFRSGCAGIPGPRGWDPCCPPPAGVGDGSEERNKKHPPLLTLGLIVDATFAGRLVDKGPPAEDGPAAREFREFWGDKSELRRYVCVWILCLEYSWGLETLVLGYQLEVESGAFGGRNGRDGMGACGCRILSAILARLATSVFRCFYFCYIVRLIRVDVLCFPFLNVPREKLG